MKKVVEVELRRFPDLAGDYVIVVRSWTDAAGEHRELLSSEGDWRSVTGGSMIEKNERIKVTTF